MRCTSAQPALADGNAALLAVIIPDRAERQRARFLEKREARGVIACRLGARRRSIGSSRARRSALSMIARADDPGGDAVDAGVEVIQADVDRARGIRRARFPARWPAVRR